MLQLQRPYPISVLLVTASTCELPNVSLFVCLDDIVPKNVDTRGALPPAS